MVLQRLLADGKVGIAGGTLGGSGESEPRTPGPCSPDSSGRAGVDERRWLPGGGLWSQCRASFTLLWGLSVLVWEAGCSCFTFLPRMALSSAEVTTER